MCPTSDHVCTRFLFVWVYGAFRSFTFGKASVAISGKLHFLLSRYESGQVGDANVNTQEATIHKEILQVISSKSCWQLKVWSEEEDL